MSTASDDLTGQRFHYLLVIARISAHRFRCRCVCGETRELWRCNLNGQSPRNVRKSCGCMQAEIIRESARQQFLTHQHSAYGRKTPEYDAWGKAIQRCENQKHPKFHCYGARGIRMCSEWRHDFLAFYQHIGPRPSQAHSLDRIDNDGPYAPGNVRWATASEQRRNQTRGDRKAVTQFA